MAEIFGTEGQSIQVDGHYACSMCGHREAFVKGGTFPADHHEGHPWTLMVADGEDGEGEGET